MFVNVYFASDVYQQFWMIYLIDLMQCNIDLRGIYCLFLGWFLYIISQPVPFNTPNEFTDHITNHSHHLTSGTTGSKINIKASLKGVQRHHFGNLIPLCAWHEPNVIEKWILYAQWKTANSDIKSPHIRQRQTSYKHNSLYSFLICRSKQHTTAKSICHNSISVRYRPLWFDKTKNITL